MTVRQLQEALQQFRPEQEVAYVADEREYYHRVNKLIELTVVPGRLTPDDTKSAEAFRDADKYAEIGVVVAVVIC